jgi:hypothetical protein
MGRFKFNRRDMKEARTKAAVVRQEERTKRTPQQQLAQLDTMFGAGFGAVRERARLQKLISG